MLVLLLQLDVLSLATGPRLPAAAAAAFDARSASWAWLIEGEEGTDLRRALQLSMADFGSRDDEVPRAAMPEGMKRRHPTELTNLLINDMHFAADSNLLPPGPPPTQAN